ncbi:MAG: YihY/virulence factor BrkB family protein [Anaerolineales bacterium]|jgi:membrane protein|nr:YihY/virulence factor BrkB family protein [Anaerolineales bacterium]
MKKLPLLALVKETFTEWKTDNSAQLAASLSYYTTFSMVPFLIVIITLAGLFGGQDAANNLVMTQVEDLVGANGREFIQEALITASQEKTGSLIASVIGTVVLVLGAIGFFVELQNSMNTIWNIKVKPAGNLRETISRFILKKVLSFSMLLGIVFLLLVSLLISALLSALGEMISSLPFLPDFALMVINFLLSLMLITALFAMIFKYLPDAQIAWDDVWLGAGITALLFNLGKFAIGFYLGRSNVSSSFGGASTLAIIMVWIYYSAQILFFGAEFTKVYANRLGSKIVPDPDAVKVKQVEVGVNRSLNQLDEGEPTHV